MFRVCIVVCLVAATYCLPQRDLSRAQNNVVATLNVTNGGIKGTWRKDEMCPSGTFAIGFEMNVSVFITFN